MPESLRKSEIMGLARRDGRVSVEALSEQLKTSVQTIRKDLGALADAGRLKRVHGGAILPSGVTNIGYEDRRELNAEAKAAIAAACAADIPNDASVFLNIGTTTEAVARALLDHHGLMVVTNNLNVANILSANPDCEVMVAGGMLRRSDGGLVGALTTRMIEQFKFDIAVIGCSAMDRDGDLLDFDVDEVTVSQTIIAQSRQVFLVADGSKFARKAAVRIGSLSDVDRFYTDAGVPADLAAQCRNWNTGVVLT